MRRSVPGRNLGHRAQPCTASLPAVARRTSRRGAVVIVQHPAQTLAAPDRSTLISMAFIRRDQPVAETLVVSLAMIMRNELVNPFSQRALTEEDHALQAGFFNAAHESLGICIQIRRSRW